MSAVAHVEQRVALVVRFADSYLRKA